jgi:hypothetical protein
MVLRCAERLVHQQHRGIVGQRTRQRGAHAHAAGKLVRHALAEVFEPHDAQKLVHALRRQRPRAAAATRHCRARCATAAGAPACHISTDAGSWKEGRDNTISLPYYA